MPNRAHLFSLRLGNALRESCFEEHYTSSQFQQDVLAGITVGIIALPLSMALAIASGVPPQHGLYTAAIAGFFIALFGGSRYSISGPTAAFIVIVYPVTQKYGLDGLLIASIMAGLIMILLALLRLGRLIEYIPEPVTLGFTGGIAIVIATTQIKDFLGLNITKMPAHYLDRVKVLIQNLSHTSSSSVGIAIITLSIMLIWPRLKTRIPPHLPAVIIASLVAWQFNLHGMHVETIQSRFSYTLADGLSGHGIPPVLPTLNWLQHEWSLLNWAMITSLLPSAFAIAMLGAIESLLCAVVLDGMTGKRHSANSELLGQGIGNLIAPLFGGITATAAIARSAANVKAGAQSPIAAMIHAVFVLLSIVLLAPLLGYLPMPSAASLLLVVAWNMSEAPKSIQLLKTAHYSDKWVFLTCISLTVVVDMVFAIAVGILLAAVLFMKEIADMTQLVEITKQKKYQKYSLGDDWHIFKVTGPLFFAAADKVFTDLQSFCKPQGGIVLYLDNVHLLDAGGVSALHRLMLYCKDQGTRLVLTEVQQQPMRTLNQYVHSTPQHILEIQTDINEILSTLDLYKRHIGDLNVGDL